MNFLRDIKNAGLQFHRYPYRLRQNNSEYKKTRFDIFLLWYILKGLVNMIFDMYCVVFDSTRIYIIEELWRTAMSKLNMLVALFCLLCRFLYILSPCLNLPFDQKWTGSAVFTLRRIRHVPQGSQFWRPMASDFQDFFQKINKKILNSWFCQRNRW